jgi:monoterpene epsilon-lactone hydrolase
MSPRGKKIYSTEDSNISKETSVFHTPDGAPIVVCNSDEEFINPTTPIDATPEEINNQLNLDLGQRFITRKNVTLLWIVDFLDKLCFQWWEMAFFKFWAEVVPLSFRRALTKIGWRFYVRLHKAFLGKSTGIHPSQSYEYHALTTIMWWARFIAVTPRRMRFSLSQLYAISPNPPPESDRITNICERPDFLDGEGAPNEQEHSCTVEGWYIHRHGKSHATERVIFWIYGGAYLAGDARGNSAAADWMGSRCDMDVFIPQIRLAPEANIDDVLWDTCVAYRWLSQRMEDPSKQIFVLGISSGGALATRLMQLIGQHSRGEPIGVPLYFSKVLEGMVMPYGGILFGPYVDYDLKKTGSFLHYPRHDLIVTESVQQHGLPYLEDFIPKRAGLENPRREYSPIHRSMEGLPPLCVVVSEHEAVYDMTVQLVNRARSDGVKVTLCVFKYMCHVFSFLLGFIPEGRISMELVSAWIVERAEEENSS